MAEDELTKLRTENIRLRNELDKQANAWGGYVDAHAGNYSRMNARIAELEATVQRLEADNKRLRWLDTIPMFAIENIARETQLASWDAWKEINEWLDSRDGAA